MRPSELSTLLAEAFLNRDPVLITGKPGIGKSDIIAQAAVAAGADLLISHPSVSDPTDFKGLPWMQAGNDMAEFVPFSEFAIALKATKPLVWFFDDLGQATPAVQAACMQLFLARRVNGHVLPECVTLVAATNRRNDRAGVTGILEPVKSRFITIIELEPTLDDWVEWATRMNINPELVAFMRFKPDLLCQFTPSADLTNCPLPRTWASVNKLLRYRVSPSVLRQAIAGAVGEGAAGEFMAFRDLYKELPNIDQILADPDKATIPTKPGTLYSVATALAYRANVKTFENIARYAQRLTDAKRGEFGALLIRDCVRRDKDILKTKAFVKLAAGELGTLIVGSK